MDKLGTQAGRLLRPRLWVPHSRMGGPGTGAGGKQEPWWGWGGGRTPRWALPSASGHLCAPGSWPKPALLRRAGGMVGGKPAGAECARMVG